MPPILRKAWAFLRRDFQIDTSYRFAFVFELLVTILPVVILFFIGKLVMAGGSSVERYGGYFPFAVVGAALTQYFLFALKTFADTIRRSQLAGCLEAILSARTRPESLVVLSSLYSFQMKLIHVVLVFVVAGLVMGVDFSRINVPAALLVMALTVLTFAGLGIFSAALIVWLKKGDPIEWVFGSLSALLGGALFPVDVMPRWMQRISAVLPMTYSLEAMRRAMLQGHGVSLLWRELLILFVSAAVLCPLSVLAFRGAVNKGRREGTLLHY
jgi:ABC-2 type transport system permease protein